MPGITGQGTTFNLPNFTGELFGITPADTPFLSAIGGLSGGKSVKAIEWEWQASDLRDAAIRPRLEGADAPAAEARARFNIANVSQIAQEAVEVSYTKLGAVGQYSGVNTSDGSNPVSDELSWQVAQALRTKAMDVELAFITGRYHRPIDNTTARRTRGLIQAIRQGIAGAANVVSAGGTRLADVAVTVANTRFTAAAHGLANGDQVALEGSEQLGLPEGPTYYVVGAAAGYFSLAASPGGAAIVPSADGSAAAVQKTAAIDGEDVLDLMQLVWQNGGIREEEGRTLMVGAAQKRRLTKLFVTDRGYQEQSRNVGGVSVTTIETDFGRVNLMLSRLVPRSALVLASLEQCKPVFMEIPDKGHFFLEPLAKTGAAERRQLYGEVGLEYGNPLAHGLLAGAAV